MRILLASSHRYPASGSVGSGPHPREYPSGSGYHLHDLLAKGLAEEGHEVSYYLQKGFELPLPPGVKPIAAPISDVDICHAPIGPLGFSEGIQQFAAYHDMPCLFTCHMQEATRLPAPNWVFVSRALAQAYGSRRFVMNGIDPNDFIFSTTKGGYLLFIGAMNKAIDKGLNVALWLARDKGFRLIVAGTALNYETIEQVRGLCAVAGAEYIGDVRGTEKAELIAGARALLFPSRLNEGCPLVVLEAMVSGTPVIASPRGGTIEIVTPETGFLCSNDEEWRDAVDRLDAISPRRCREIALQNYHYRNMVQSYLLEYRREIENFAG